MEPGMEQVKKAGIDDSMRVAMDLRGQECPVPTAKTVDALREIRRNQRDETVVVKLDDAVCAAQIPYEARRLDFSARTTKTADSEWEIVLTPRAKATRRT